jgi:hypothetical protein
MKRLALSKTVLCMAMMMGCSSEIIMETGATSSSTSVGGSTSSGMGGAGGVGETGGMGGSGGPSSVSPPPECTFDSDCTLVNDCCTCQGISANESIPDCPSMECFAPACNAIGLATPMAVCRAGQCVVNGDCNQDHALCNAPPPVCSPGQTPLVVNNCWGGCVNVVECQAVGSCAQCGADQACVTANTMMVPAQHCVNAPDSCMNQISCACMGEMVCGFATSCLETSATELQCLDITTK